VEAAFRTIREKLGAPEVLLYNAGSGNWGTVTEFCVFDAATSGNLLFRATLQTPQTISNGAAAPSFAISALTWTIN